MEHQISLSNIQAENHHEANHPDVDLFWNERSIFVDTTCSGVWVQ
jgi:hypothetical protein